MSPHAQKCPLYAHGAPGGLIGPTGAPRRAHGPLGPYGPYVSPMWAPYSLPCVEVCYGWDLPKQLAHWRTAGEDAELIHAPTVGHADDDPCAVAVSVTLAIGRLKVQA